MRFRACDTRGLPNEVDYPQRHATIVRDERVHAGSFAVNGTGEKRLVDPDHAVVRCVGEG